MSLRIGVDMDGTLADLSSLFHEYEAQLFGQPTTDEPREPGEEDPEPTDREKLKAAKARGSRRRLHLDDFKAVAA